MRVDLAAEDRTRSCESRIARMCPSPSGPGLHLDRGRNAGRAYPTDDIILNPPVFTVAPGKTRFMRLGLRTANHGTAELTYRLILQEVPKAEGPSDGAAVRTILRISIPIFAVPKRSRSPEWSGRSRNRHQQNSNWLPPTREMRTSRSGNSAYPRRRKLVQQSVCLHQFTCFRDRHTIGRSKLRI